MPPMREVSGLDDEGVRREVIDSARPAVLRGLVDRWPLVAAARKSPQAVVETLRRLDNGAPVDAVLLPPECAGRIGYDATMSGFNFVRNRLPITAVAEQVLRYSAFPQAPAVAAQSALIRDCLPGLSRENALTLLPESVLPRIWLGNAITTPTHLDEWNNIGCVAAGRRRFTLFPPEQIANLYPGPLDPTPAGQVVTMVDFRAPDLERYPISRASRGSARRWRLQ
jgi:hypothetical protein